MEQQEQAKIIRPSDITWEAHPCFTGLTSAMFVSNRDDQVDLTCMLTRVMAGTIIDGHAHECDEIIYVLEGNAIMSIEGTEDVAMMPGTFFRIPKGMEHRPHTIKENILAYNVFHPFLK